MTTLQLTYPDRREHPRVAIDNCMFDANLKFGRVIDISITGMAFYYADRQPWADRGTFKGTLCLERMNPIRNLQMQTVCDIELPNNYAPGSMAVRRRSVRFDQLSHIQMNKLTELIEQISQQLADPATPTHSSHYSQIT